MNDLLDGVARYLEPLGWRRIWIVRNSEGKLVPLTGSTGHNGTDLPRPADPVTLSIGCPDGVAMIDVDQYKDKTGADTLKGLEAELGPLPPTVRITSRGPSDPGGKFPYRVPPGTILKGSAGDYIEIIQRHHRWTWAPGTTHPKTGTPVMAYGPDGAASDLPAVPDLPPLPGAWLDYLRADDDTAGERVPVDVPDDGVTVCDAAKRWLAGRDFAGAEARGQRANDAAVYLKRKAAEGHYVAAIIDAVRDVLPDTSDRDWDSMWNGIPVEQGYRDPDLTCCGRGLFGLTGTMPPSANGHAYGQAQEGTATSATFTGLPPAGSPLNLPAEFWAALPVLGRIRAAAWSRNRPADAVLAAVLARVAAMWPPHLRLDTGTASPASANYYAALCGPPGTGKTTSAGVARDLLPSLAGYPSMRGLPDSSVLFADDVPLGSGEGLAEAYITTVTVDPPDGKGKPKLERRKTRDHAFVFADEGAALAAMLERSGATIGETLRRGWSGETIGQANASAERTRIVPRGTYSLGLVIGFQPSTIGGLIADAPAGTPQRFAYASATDPAIPDDPPDWPGALELKWAEIIPRNTAETWQAMPLPFAGEVKREIRIRDLARARGAEQAAPFAEHEILTRAKMAALLAVLGGAGEVTAELWELSAVMWATSCAVRDSMAAYGAQVAADAEQRIRGTMAGRQIAIEDATDERAMAQAVRSAARHIHRQACEDGCKRRCVTRSIKSTVLRQVSMDEVIERITAAGYAEADGDVLRPGRVSPP